MRKKLRTAGRDAARVAVLGVVLFVLARVFGWA
jgi:hypothetical protein